MDNRGKIIAMQKACGTVQDGNLGPHTMDVMYRRLVGHDVPYPYAGYFWSSRVILARPDQFRVAYVPGKLAVKTGNYRCAINGTFYDYATRKVVSLLGDQSGVHGYYSCRSWAGFPETVLYFDGVSVKKTTAKWSGELHGARWFVGGIDLIDLKPEREGFCKFTHDGKTWDYRDVLRGGVYHACIGVDRTGVLHAFLVYGDVNKAAQTAKNLMLQHAIMIDGGSPASINSKTQKYYANKAICNVIYFE